ncbi:hypothetical protein NECID01_1519 [Nematocida sp. AWRm77]|nr:hypothetical protein NECID01_1519 [Nematocida sp. AWRm77]
MSIIQERKQAKLFLLICCICLALLLMVRGTDLTLNTYYIAEIQKINASVEEDRAKIETDKSTAYVAALAGMNEYCATNSKRRSDANIKEVSMFLQNSDTILKRYAADRRACMCLLPLLVEKYAAQLTAKKQDPEKVQDTLRKIAQDLFYNYSFFLEENHEDNHLETVITTEHAALCDKWKAAAKEVEALLEVLAQTEKEDSAQNLPNAPSPDLLSFIEDWKRLVANQAEIRDSLVSLLKDALPRLEDKYFNDTRKKEEYISFIRNTTEFMFLTEYTGMLDRYYFSNTPSNSPNSTPPPDFRLETFAADTLLVLGNTFKDRGIVFAKTHQEDGILRERLNELCCLYRDFIQPKHCTGSVETTAPDRIATDVLYNNQKYPKHTDKSRALSTCSFKALKGFQELYTYGKGSAPDKYCQHFQSVISPLLEKANGVVNVAISVAEDPELFKTQNKIDKLLDEIKDLTALHKAPNGHAIDLSLGSSMDEEIMKKWVQAAFQLPELPVYYDMAKEDSNDLIQNYKAYKKNRRNAKASWSSYLVKDIASPPIKEKVQALETMLDGINTLVECIVGCMMNTVKDDALLRNLAGGIVFTHYLYAIDKPVALIAIALYNRTVQDLNLSLVNPLEEYQKALMDTYIKCFRTTPKDLDQETRADLSLASFYANPKATAGVCTELLDVLRMLDASTTNLEQHFRTVSAFSDAIKVFRSTQAKLEGHREKALAYSTPRPVSEASVSIDMQLQIQKKFCFMDEIFSKYREAGRPVHLEYVLEVINWAQGTTFQLTDLQKCIDSLDPSINTSPCKESLEDVGKCLHSLVLYLNRKLTGIKKQIVLEYNIGEGHYIFEVEYFYGIIQPLSLKDIEDNGKDARATGTMEASIALLSSPYIVCGVTILLAVGGVVAAIVF